MARAWRDGLCYIRFPDSGRSSAIRSARSQRRRIAISAGYEHQNPERIQTLRESPWQTNPPEPENAAPQPPTFQRISPWAQGQRTRSTPSGFPGSRITTTPTRSTTSGFPGHVNGKSVMVNIVQKLRAIERRNLVQNQQNPTRGITTVASVPGKDAEVDKFPWSNKFQQLEEVPVQPPSRTMAEMTLSERELRRLQNMARGVSNPIKIGYLGVTKAVVADIHKRWQRNEVIRISCSGPAAVNMRKTHDELEAKTGGLVVWRTAGMATIYRGKAYFSRHESKIIADRERVLRRELPPGSYTDVPFHEAEKPHYYIEGGTDLNPEDEYINEVDAILGKIGPRYDEWMGNRPVPVDADLLPSHVRNFKPPVRMLPHGVRRTLSGLEITVLRKLARPLPPHFVVGRNRGLQGLAAGIIRLWEKSEIVKIGIKRSIDNTRNQLIAEELQRLTGGVILMRDKYFIVLFRGKDFLPMSVAAVLKEREVETEKRQEFEEKLRLVGGVADAARTSDTEPPSGSLAESQQMKKQWEATRDKKDEKQKAAEALVAAKVRQQRVLEAKLAAAMTKKRVADLHIAKLEQTLKISEASLDREAISDEERHMFRKLGLRMGPFLLLGRRGIFSGIVENMHLHWKYRELVKLIMKEKDKTVARDVGRMLAAESGGILVDVVTTSKGQAIIVYRGKNYQRPAQLRPMSLLTKRKALARSKEIQRKEAFSKHIEKLETLIKKLRKDYDHLLTSTSLPESPRSALYKEIGEKYDDDEAVLKEDLPESETEAEDESELKYRDEAEETEDESEWDLVSEDEKD